MMLGCLLFMIFGLNLSVLMIVIFYGIMMLGHRMSFSNTLAESLKVEKGNCVRMLRLFVKLVNN